MSVALLLGAVVLVAAPRRFPAMSRLPVLVAAGRLPVAPHDPSPARPIRRVLLAGPAVLMLVALALGAALQPLALVAAAAVVALVARQTAHAARARQRTRAEQSILGALRVLRAELDAGSGEAEALRAAASVAGPGAYLLRHAATLAAAGADVSAGLAGPSADPDADAVEHLRRALVRVWRVRADCGAALAELIGHVEVDYSATADRRRAVHAAVAGPRSSALVLAALPAVGLAMGAALGAHPVTFLVRTPLGSAVLLAGVTLDVIGVVVTDRITGGGSRRP